MAKLRRVGGEMESHRRIAGRRILLPAEAELCNTLGLSEVEYFYFLDLTESELGKRAKGYELIPDIRNGAAVLTFLGTPFGKVVLQLVIGIAINLISNLLRPKPKQPKTPPSLATAGLAGQRRYAPQSGFNSVQELAALGEIIPLVFTRREDGHGGIRINTKLLWSQMRSYWSGQQLRGLFLLSKGTLDADPDFAGYAIGDTTLANYTNAKIALYSKLSGGRIKDTDKYIEGTLDPEIGDTADVFSVHWDREGQPVSNIVSGTRTPGSQTQFGAFAPMSNSMRFMVPYELVLKGKDLSDENKADVDKKRNKIETAFPRYAAVTSSTGTAVGDTVTYVISDQNPATQEHFDDEFNPWGMEDVKSSVDADRINADNNLAMGDSYLIGSALAVCKKINYGDGNKIWIPDTNTTVEATFDLTDTGIFDVRADGIEKAHHPYELTVIQRAALGTITTNTKCEVTEIGIKSTVWRQITGFPNANSHPGHITYEQPGTVKNYENDNGNISLGQMSKYINRYSFFRLQGRIAGQYPIATWEYLDNGIPFAVRGNAPQPQYNFIRINHEKTHQYEFRFVPYPGNLIQRELQDNAITTVRLFQKNSLSKVESTDTKFDTYYSGNLYQLTGNRASNPEWYLGELPKLEDTEDSGVLSLSSNDNNNGVPISKGWQFVEEQAYDTYNFDDYHEPVMGVKFNSSGKHKQGYTKTATFYWGTKSGRHHWGSTKVVGVLSTKTAGASYPWSQQATEVQFPYYIKDAYDKEEYSVIGEDGYQYRIGTVRCEFGDCSDHNFSDKVASIRKYEWESSDANTVHDDWNTTTITGNGTGLTLTVTVYQNTPYSVTWQVKNPGSGYRTGDKVSFTIPNHASDAPIQVTVLTDSGALVTDDPWPIGRNLNPYDAISDFVRYDSEQSSHLTRPEHELVYCNELHKSHNIDYLGLAYTGLRLNSSKEWSSFSQFSAYLKKGIQVERLINNNIEATNLFPEIAYTLLTDSELGAGDLIGPKGVDKDRMTNAAKFCEANGFYWDGVITEGQNLREFIFEMSGYCFLDFTILGGKFSLIPSVPYNSDFTINASASFSDPDGTSDLKIKALFTDGNTKSLKVSFLNAEERQLFKGRALYRHETENGFPETKVVELGLADVQSQADYPVGSAEDPIETFDLSNFCTSSAHAYAFLRYALRVRQLVDHGITFETTPQDAMFLEPGNYFRYYSESTHTSRFDNGSISSDGTVQSIGESNLSDVDIYYWRSGMEEVEPARIQVINGKTDLSDVFNSVFTVKRTNKSDRVYKVESLSYGEEGLIEVAASHVPLTATGKLAILDWTASDFA